MENHRPRRSVKETEQSLRLRSEPVIRQCAIRRMFEKSNMPFGYLILRGPITEQIKMNA